MVLRTDLGEVSLLLFNNSLSNSRYTSISQWKKRSVPTLPARDTYPYVYIYIRSLDSLGHSVRRTPAHTNSEYHVTPPCNLRHLPPMYSPQGIGIIPQNFQTELLQQQADSSSSKSASKGHTTQKVSILRGVICLLSVMYLAALARCSPSTAPGLQVFQREEIFSCLRR